MARAKYSFNEKYPNHFVAIRCPGCNSIHVMAVKHHPDFEADESQKRGKTPVWGFNFNFDLPTFDPSLKVTTGMFVPGYENWEQIIPLEQQEDFVRDSSICHTYITDGRIRYLSDCTHALVNQTIDLPELLP